MSEFITAPAIWSPVMAGAVLSVNGWPTSMKA
jgi:hypothetical protein